MDAEMRRTLGGALMGALILLVGIALRNSPTYEVQVVGAALLLGGGIVFVACIAKVAVAMMRTG